MILKTIVIFIILFQCSAFAENRNTGRDKVKNSMISISIYNRATLESDESTGFLISAEGHFVTVSHAITRSYYGVKEKAYVRIENYKKEYANKVYIGKCDKTANNLDVCVGKVSFRSKIKDFIPLHDGIKIFAKKGIKTYLYGILNYALEIKPGVSRGLIKGYVNQQRKRETAQRKISSKDKDYNLAVPLLDHSGDARVGFSGGPIVNKNGDLLGMQVSQTINRKTNKALYNLAIPTFLINRAVGNYKVIKYKKINTY